MDAEPGKRGYFSELKRRNVFKVAVAYAATGWILIESASVILPITHAPEWVMQVFTLVIAAGFPLALIFAWAFELTPEGLKRTHEVPLEHSISAKTGKRLNLVIIAILAILLAISLAFDVYEPGLDDHPPEGSALASSPTIAVLPLKKLSPESQQQEDEYLAVGMTDSIITALYQYPDLRVTARNSSFMFQDRSTSLQEIGEKLGVRYVMEGSIFTAGSTMRTSIQLIDASDGKQIWAGSFDRHIASREDILDVLDDVAQATVTAILSPDAGPLATSERQRALAESSDSLDAYKLFMRGKQAFYNYDAVSNAEARAYFERSIALEPEFAKAHSNLAWTHALDFDFEWSEDPEASLNLAFESALRAHELDDNDYESLWALGWAYLNQEGKHDVAMRLYERALELNANDAEMLAEMGYILIYSGQPERAIEQILRAIERHPYRDQWYDEYLGWAYEEAGRYEDAIAILSVIDQHEGWWGRAYLACSYAETGQLDAARAQIDRSRELEPDWSWAFYLDWVNNKRRYRIEEQRDRRIACMARAMGMDP